MPSFRERVAEGIARGTYRKQLAEDARQWRAHRSDYALSTVVRYTAEDDLADEVHDVLTDEQFRELRLARFGVLALRDDLDVGLEYFSRARPDLLRYTRLLFRRRSAERDDTYASLHRRHCQGFADFLQLDVPAADRQEIGLERALHRLFPMRLTDDDDLSGPPVDVDLTGYDLGTWACSCGSREGHAARYDHACDCGAMSGNGRLPARARRCRRCRTTATYATCDRCGTRVTLSLWWQIRQGGVHPSECRIPLTLELRNRRAGQQSAPWRLEVMRLPLMLGLTERDDELVFDLPDMLWVSDVRDRHGRDRPTGQLVAVADHPRYDRQNDVERILEAAFRRTVTRRNRPAGSELRAVIAAQAGLRRSGRRRRHTDDFSARFARRVGYALAAESPEEAGLARGADLYRPCTVAVSPGLRGDAALVSPALSTPGALSGSGLDNIGVSLRITPLGPDQLTAEPPEVKPDLCGALASDGIVLPGDTVEPGDLLVGISTPRTEESLNPEERLLRAIFGEKYDDRQDASFRWAGRHPARVLSVHIGTAASESCDVAWHPARVVQEEVLRPGERARISISLATTDPLETGDVLYGPDDSRAVVCGTQEAHGTDVLVGPDHPWATEGPARTVGIRLRPDERSRSAVSARATGSYSMVRQLPVPTDARDPGLPVRLTDLAWLLRHGASRTAFELHVLRSDSVDGRLGLFELLVKGGTSLRDIPLPPSEHATTLESAPIEAVRNWGRLLRAACVEPVWHGDRLSFRAIDDEQVLAASFGEVRNFDTMDLRTRRPVPGGLACQSIFGPVRDHACGCGKLRGPGHAGELCPRCGVEVVDTMVRRRRMGHIELAAPMVHPWYEDHLADALGIDRRTLADIIHGRCHVVRDGDRDEFVLPPAAAEPRPDDDRLCTGADAVRLMFTRRGQAAPRGALLHRLPVLPADLRPAIVHEGRVHISALNEPYRQIVSRTSRVRQLIAFEAPPQVIGPERTRLQQAVDSLLDPVEGRATLADLTTILPGRDGGFRERLFERPADFSARTTLVAEATGDLDAALLPDRLAWTLLAPALIGRLVDTGTSPHITAAQQAVRDRTPQAWAQLQALCGDTTVLVSVPETRWPLFAVRVARLTGDLSLKLDPGLLDHLGWDRLGVPVRIFPLLTDEAATEARGALLPSTLLRDAATEADEPTPLPPSLLGLDQEHLPKEIVRMIETGDSAHLDRVDRFLLFPEWER
ncbi:hypothetical protein [Streptomyces sp. NPDC056361]|uniref:hypothetical protein n=1 Tax=Streptomyces sp. NPDC056361 TaxID=3345795 RepID=UPI0035E090CA